MQMQILELFAKIKRHIYIALGIYAFIYAFLLFVYFLQYFSYSLHLILGYYYIVIESVFYTIYALFMARGIFLLSRISKKRIFIYCLIDLFLVYVCNVLDHSSLSVYLSPASNKFYLAYNLLKWTITINYALYMWELFKISNKIFFIYSLIAAILSVSVGLFDYIFWFFGLFKLFLSWLAFLTFVIAWIQFKQIPAKKYF